jgi:hypothetical protein
MDCLLDKVVHVNRATISVMLVSFCFRVLIVPRDIRAAASKKWDLFPENLADLPDLVLDFTGNLFTGTFSFKLGVISEFAGDFLGSTLYFVKLALNLVFRAVFHGILLN